MSEKLLRYLPYAIGLALGWMLVSPPAVFDSLGWARWPATGALVLLLLVAMTALTILANLPADIALDPAEGVAPPAEVGGLADRLLALGFQQAGPLLRVGVSPPGLLLPFVHPGDQAYATVFRTGTAPAKTAYEFVSLLAGERAGLTSTPEPAGTYLPGGPGSFRQALPGRTPEQLYAQHRESLAYLRSRGLAPCGASAADFPRVFREAFARQRRRFLASPLPVTLLMLWRATTGRTPHLGPIRQQHGIDAQVREALTGARQPA